MDASDQLLRDPRKALFDLLDDVRAGMLGLTAAGQGLQPMTHFPDRAAGIIWFISSTDTDLVQGVDQGEDADYVATSRDQSAHASLRGKLYQVRNDEKLDALWSPMVGAWFAGRDDPKIALLRFDPETADLWQSTASAPRFGFEMVRATLDSDHRPDLGARATVTFPPSQ